MADGVKLSEWSADNIEEMIRGNYADIFRYCFWRTKQQSDAEDLTQETFLRFINSLSHFCFLRGAKRKPAPLDAG